jgi:hypothetical protein
MRYFFFVALAYGVATFATGLTNYLTKFELSRTTNFLLSGGVGLVSALSLGAIDLAKEGKGDKPAAQPAPTAMPYGAPAATPYGAHPAYYSGAPTAVGPATPRRRRGWGGVLIGALVLLAICGGGGYALTTGVSWASDKLSDIAAPPWKQVTKDPGVERLAAPASNTAGPLTITISSVRVNRQVTIVKISAKNSGSDTLTLPVFSSAQLTVPGSKTLAGDPAASDNDGNIQVPPGGEWNGNVVFDGVIPSGSAQVTLSFAQIYGGFNTPRSIAVPFTVT